MSSITFNLPPHVMILDDDDDDERVGEEGEEEEGNVQSQQTIVHFQENVIY